eukprot:GHVT01080821.1.p1 GENE.GHVT01080821.1~~GHVT01080821.1.p1  ORF type:complete len:125 (+),score=15.39 GHVT01080821.1:378-752(+)
MRIQRGCSAGCALKKEGTFKSAVMLGRATPRASQGPSSFGSEAFRPTIQLQIVCSYACVFFAPRNEKFQGKSNAVAHSATSRQFRVEGWARPLVSASAGHLREEARRVDLATARGGRVGTIFNF